MSISTELHLNEKWFKISDHDRMRPFFMSIVSDSNHWMFISSNGGLTAGRKNSEYALFPYYTDDKITESADITGSKTIFQVRLGNETVIWEPFSDRFTGQHRITRNLSKNLLGNKVMFEEVNHDLGLTFRYTWQSSAMYGFVRTAELRNESGTTRNVTVLDGLQNLMPYGVEPDMQTASSNLADAYKRSEILAESGLGIYALSAIIVDKAEPSEALKANVVWSNGLENPRYLLSSLQLNAFRRHQPITPETDIKGEKGAYFLHASVSLTDGEAKSWDIVANVNQNHAQVVALHERIRQQPAELMDEVRSDVDRGSQALARLISGADGFRKSGDPLKDARHYSNVLFNIMRGGTFDHNYTIEKADLNAYLSNASKPVAERNREFLQELGDVLDKQTLFSSLEGCDDPDLYRLCKEYLPLKFSRRHGDPSRPWNKFSINTNSEVDGSKILDYEGNWRDIFQNWEALVHSYPEFIEGMIFKFLNTSTFEGYNPYRVTKGGFDWETIEPDNPWSYIGYWGDHQIIYLLKFLEFYRQYEPHALEGLFDKSYFVYANVPYRIKPYDDIARDPKNTIDFDEPLDHTIRERVALEGADGALIRRRDGHIHRVNFMEKVLVTVLAKVSNFIPEGGIWMNTQRPEWNDANNALVGNGVSMVTLYYLRRFLKFFEQTLSDASLQEVPVSEEVHTLFTQILTALTSHTSILEDGFDDASRKMITDALGTAGSDYRIAVYEQGFSGNTTVLTIEELRSFVEISLKYLEQSIDANRRDDHLYHSYNIMTMNPDGIAIAHLSEMLEGQVAVLSSGYLTSEQSSRLLDALRSSALYRPDQNSYMLYPNKELPRFLQKNTMEESAVAGSPLLKKLVADGNLQLITRDVRGAFHFNGNFRNAADVKEALEALRLKGYANLVETDTQYVLNLFEQVFNHKAFTGRSGTFFAYEGLGSIYWHMVSKLHLAVQEVCLKAQAEHYHCTESLLRHFQEIGEGIGVHKSPELYGAFPTDPYSHTPQHRGAQQPGMTGQVKEDILVSLGELGVHIAGGKLAFRPTLLRKAEFTREAGKLDYVNLHQQNDTLTLPERSLCFTCCQVPVVYTIGAEDTITVTTASGQQTYSGLILDESQSNAVFNRTGEIRNIQVTLREDHLI